ncbi:MAG: GAF domain-containing protein [Flavobacteriales bacterium]|nr:GAF domain-containing protein [Flavobacteriales bacterium]
MTGYLPPPAEVDRPTRDRLLLEQCAALVADGPDAIAVMANLSAALHAAYAWHWVGFYRVVGDELVLGPFHGPPACVRIARGKGVCGHAWATGQVLVVPNVDAFPGHIACSALSRSELVVPVRGRSGEVAAVLDVDSMHLDDFSDQDLVLLEKVAALLSPWLV